MKHVLSVYHRPHIIGERPPFRSPLRWFRRC